MADQSLAVSITANTTDLNTKMALAKAALASTTAELTKQSKAALQTGADLGTMIPVVTRLTQEQTSARAVVRALTGEHIKHGGAVNQNRMAYMEFGHVVRSATDSLAAGASPMRVLEVEGSRLVQAFSELNSTTQTTIVKMAAAAGPVAVLAGGLAYLAVKAIAAEGALASMDNKVAAAGRGGDVLSGKSRQWASDLADRWRMSTGEAAGLVSQVDGLGTASERTRLALLNLAPAVAKASDDDPAKVMASFVGGFGDVSALENFARKNNLLTADLQGTLAAAKDVGGVFQAQDAVVAALAARYGAFGDKVVQAKQAQRDSMLAGLAAVAGGAADAGGMGIDVPPPPKMPRLANTSSQLPSEDEQRAQATLSASARYETVQDKINADLKVQADLEAQIRDGVGLSANTMAQLKDRAAGVTDEIAKLRQEQAGGGSEFSAQEEQMMTDLRNRKIYGEARLAYERKVITQEIEVAKAGGAAKADELRRLDMKLNEIDDQQHAMAEAGAKHSATVDMEDFTANIRAKQAAEKGNAAAVLADETVLLGKLKAVYGERSKSYQNELAHQSELEGQAASTRLRAIESEETRAIASMRRVATADLEHVTRQREDGDLSITAARSKELQIVEAHTDAALVMLQTDQQMALFEPMLAKKIADEIVAVKRWEADQTQAINDVTTAKIKAQDRDIANSAASTLTGMLTGRETFAQAVENVGERLVQRAIAWGLEEVLNTVRTQTLNTGAVAAGAGAQVAIKATAAASGKAIDAAAGSVSVIGDAHKAAAGAYAALAGVPIIGPVIAPLAAAGAFTAVAAFDVFSAEGGMARVPYDDAPALLHRNEMVLPAHLADTIRAGGGGGGFNVHPGAITIHGARGQSEDALAAAVVSKMRNMHRNGVFGSLSTAVQFQAIAAE